MRRASGLGWISSVAIANNCAFSGPRSAQKRLAVIEQVCYTAPCGDEMPAAKAVSQSIYKELENAYFS
jgi:hypothetical protein